MAYLMSEVPVFDTDDQVGLIHQIHNSLKQVKDATFQKKKQSIGFAK